jgi:hypothetical protein
MEDLNWIQNPRESQKLVRNQNLVRDQNLLRVAI